jgi:hypothetical protein
MLDELADELKQDGVRLLIAREVGQVREVLRTSASIQLRARAVGAAEHTRTSTERAQTRSTGRTSVRAMAASRSAASAVRRSSSR